MRTRGLVALAAGMLMLTGVGVGGCGGDDGGDVKGPRGESPSQFKAELETASKPTAADFPAVKGRTLQQVADSVEPGPQLGFATSEYTVGSNRVAFGIIGTDQKFVYGKSAIYVAPTPNSPAQGPYPAPAQSLIVDPPFRSQNAATEESALAAIYATHIPLQKTGRYAVLSVTRSGAKLLGAAGEIEVKRTSAIPAPGQKPPAIDTPTVASVGGDIAKIDTRTPHDDMHRDNFKDVLGKKPVVLLFSTPALCQSRVCGPVTDIEAQLEKEFGDRASFIHMEVYNDNEVKKGLRPQLDAFHLTTEPWLFTFDRSGRVADRLAGSFGIDEFRAAVQKAVQGS